MQRGYRWGWFDYQDELSIRDVLEAVIQDPAVCRFAEAKPWAEGVAVTDARFRSVTRPVGGTRASIPWWRGVIPMKAGPRLAADVQEALGERIEPLRA